MHYIIFIMAAIAFTTSIILLTLENNKGIEERNKYNIYIGLLVSFACFFILLMYTIIFLLENMS